MLYQLTKPFAKLTLAAYFRKIYLTNLDVIPKDKPVIFAANHPTAFIEPCLLACWLDRRLHFLARGDLYLKPWLRKLYDIYGLIPVFRLDDAGYGRLKSNFGSFDRVYKAFKEKKAVMILAEGRTKHEKRLRPIMKGAARLVFGAMEKYGDLDIHIVPTAINYSNPDQFRSVAMIDFGAPIRVSEYLELYREHPFRAVTQLTREISKRLAERVIHIDNAEDDELAEQLLMLKRNEERYTNFPVVSQNPIPLLEEKGVTDWLNKLDETKKQVLKNKLETYLSKLRKAEITDLGLTHLPFFTVQHALLYGAGWLPYFVGKILNAPPLLLGDWLSHRLAQTIEFRASMAVVFSAVAYLFYLTGLVAVLIWWKSAVWAAGALVLPLLGYYSLLFADWWKVWKESEDAATLEDDEAEALLKERLGIFR